MKLSRAVLSIGNTHTVICGVNELGAFAEKKSFSSANGVEKEIVEWCDHHLGPQAKIAVASVVPARLKAMQSVIAHHGFHFIECSAELANLPLKISYRTPHSLGADRIAAAIGAFAIAQSAVAVVDCGTATTMTVVNARGEILGGSITLGLFETMKTLAERGAQLHEVSFAAPHVAIGTSTEESLQIGIVLGHAVMIDGMIEKIKKEVGEVATIITGGAADTLTKYLSTEHKREPDLVLKGLATLVNNGV